MEAADRDEAVRLRLEETLEGVRVGMKLVLAVEVVEVEAVRRLVFIWWLSDGEAVVDDVNFCCAGFRGIPELKVEAVVMIPCLLFADTEYPRSGVIWVRCG